MLNNPITERQIPGEIARDSEFQAADQAHINASNPHPQYVLKSRSFRSPAISPINLQANVWQPLGEAVEIGELGEGTLWDVMAYFQYIDTTGGNNHPYFQYCGGGTLGAIYWQADLLINEGILVPAEAHNEQDFTFRLRFGRGNQFRRVEIKVIDRNINITSPGFCRVSGVRRLPLLP